MFFREGLKRLYNMLTAEDKVLLAGKGITEEQIEAQLQTFKKGFPFLKLKAAASLAHGIWLLRQKNAGIMRKCGRLIRKKEKR